MTIATINRFIHLFADSLRQLGAEVPDRHIEAMAMLIHDSMEHGRRVYHTSHHVFTMSEGLNPRQVLATLFHDVVYYQLDDGFPRRARRMLNKVARASSRAVVLKPVPEDDRGLLACTTLFGFEAGQNLPIYGGLNEFLSAVVAMRTLQPWLPMTDLVAIAACIEATVPFRGPDRHGREAAEVLADRLAAVARILDVHLDDGAIDAMVRDAVVVGNRDVCSFGASDPGIFLANTWQLIEESNAPLAAVGVYSVREYRSALMRMEAFLATLDPDHIFHRHGDTPGDAEFTELRALTRRNLELAAGYLGAKVATIAVVEALALATGGDCPASMLLGDIRSPDGGVPVRVEQYLPPAPITSRVDPELLAALETGRPKESGIDLRVSPLTAFLYRSLGHDGTAALRREATLLFTRKISGRRFLKKLDPALVQKISQACASIAISRREALLSVCGRSTAAT